VALIDDDAVEEVRRIIAEVGGRLAFLIHAGHEGLKDGEENAAVLRYAASSANLIGADAHQGIVGEGGKRGELTEDLPREDIAVGQKQDSRPAGRFTA
jgi:hypothetical protein